MKPTEQVAWCFCARS